MTSSFGQQGDDEVVARLSVDIPPESAAGLQTIARQARDLRTTMEAISKAQGDYNRYVQQLPELLRRAEQAQERFTAQANQLDPRDPSSSPAPHRPPSATESSALVREMMAAPGFQQMVATIAAAAGGATPGTAAAGAGGAPVVNPASGGGSTAPPGQVRSVAGAMEELRQRDPRQYANLMAQHGAAPSSGPSGPGPGGGTAPSDPRNERPTGPQAPVGPPDWFGEGKQMEQQALGVLSKILSQTASGGNVGILTTAGLAGQGAMGFGLNIQRRLQQRIEHHAAEAVRLDQERADLYRAGGSEEDQFNLEQAAAQHARTALRTNQAAGAARTMTRGGAAVGLVAGAAVGTQEVGEWMQRHRTVGMIRGGGFQEGFAFEAGIRQMAMNPFLTTEQSRKIMMDALNRGFTGKEFDTITEFMAENLKELNISASDSMRMVSSQRNVGGQSLESIQSDLQDIKRFVQMNPDSRRTATDFTEKWQANTEIGVSGGFSGEQASRLAFMGEAAFADSGSLRNVGTGIVSGVTNSPAGQNAVANFLEGQGSPYDKIGRTLEEQGGEQEIIRAGGKAIEQAARDVAPQFASGDRQTSRMAVISFRDKVNYLFPDMQLDENAARSLMLEALSDEGLVGGQINPGLEKGVTAQTGGPGAAPSWADRGKALARSTSDASLAGLYDIGEFLTGDLFGGGDGNPISRWFGRKSDELNVEQREQRALGMTSWMNPAVKDFIQNKNVNAGEVMLKDQNGEEITLQKAMEANKTDILKGLPGGETQVRMPGSDNFTSFVEATNQLKAEGETDPGNKTLIDLTERAAEYLRKIPDDPRNTSQRGADTGQEGYSRQEPAPNETPGG